MPSFFAIQSPEVQIRRAVSAPRPPSLHQAEQQKAGGFGDGRKGQVQLDKCVASMELAIAALKQSLYAETTR